MTSRQPPRKRRFFVRAEPSGQQPAPFRVVAGDQTEVALVSAFLDGCTLRGLSPRTIRTYAFALRSICEWLLDRSSVLEDLTQADLTDFILYLRDEVHPRVPAPRSINLKLIVLRAFFAFHQQRDLPRAAGAAREPKPIFARRAFSRTGIPQRLDPRRAKLRVKVPQTLTEPLTREAVKSFLAGLRTFRDLALVKLMLFSGLRSREVLNLQFENLQFELHQIRVLGKGQRERLVPVAKDSHSVLTQYLRLERPKSSDPHVFLLLKGPRRGQPMTPAGLRALFRYHRLRSGVARGNPHRFRHTCALDMVRAGMSLPALMRLLGHANIETTMLYVRFTIDDLREEFQRAVIRRSSKRDVCNR